MVEIGKIPPESGKLAGMERKNPIVFHDQRSKVKVVALLNRKTL
jgi:hypothetical protein